MFVVVEDVCNSDDARAEMAAIKGTVLRLVFDSDGKPSNVKRKPHAQAGRRPIIMYGDLHVQFHGVYVLWSDEMITLHNNNNNV